jgi:(1->4)-alpha-D-glucan 1-alpha-D-glucosylmutase
MLNSRGEPTDYFALGRENKRECLKTTLLAAELRRLDLAAVRLSPRERKEFCRSFPMRNYPRRSTEILVCFPIYRSPTFLKTMADPRRTIAAIKAFAVHLACEQRQRISAGAFCVHSVAAFAAATRKIGRERFIRAFPAIDRFPVMAKGVEDTAFYRFNRFTSLNEVGGAIPTNVGIGMDAFHEAMRRRQADWPHSQLTTSTHDTKRAEDVRARLNVLSEIPELWMQTVRRWSALNCAAPAK